MAEARQGVACLCASSDVRCMCTALARAFHRAEWRPTPGVVTHVEIIVKLIKI